MQKCINMAVDDVKDNLRDLIITVSPLTHLKKINSISFQFSKHTYKNVNTVKYSHKQM